MTENQPIQKLKAGAVSLSVFANNSVTKEGKKIAYNTVALQRSYKDKEGKWQHTGSLRVNDLPNAILVLQKIFENLIFKQLNGNGAQPAAANDSVYEETL